MFLTSSRNYDKTNTQILKHSINKEGYYCVYVTVNKPYSSLKKKLEKEKINIQNIFFIDAVSPVEETRAGNAVFVGSPKALTKISLVSNKALQKMPENKRLLFLDSLSTISLYNKKGNVSKFADFIIRKRREGNMKAAIISLKKDKKGTKEISNYLSQLVDKVIEVG